MGLIPLASQRSWCALPPEAVRIAGQPPFDLLDTSGRLNRWLVVMAHDVREKFIDSLSRVTLFQPALLDVLRNAVKSDVATLGFTKLEPLTASGVDLWAHAAWMDRPLVTQLINAEIGLGIPARPAVISLEATSQPVSVVDLVATLDQSATWAGLLFEGVWRR